MTATIIHQLDSLPRHLGQRDFDFSYWAQQPDTVLLAGGRGGSQKIILEQQQFVLRQYLRGGLVARILKDRYWWTGLQSSRPHREDLAVRAALRAGLPVPEVVAYQVQRLGMLYRAAIMSRYVANQGTLASYLYDREMPAERWRQLGHLLRQLHQAGIAHADLNANNILMQSSGDFCLIDFDKARVGVTDQAFASRNLQRLLRSLNKIRRQRREAGQLFRFSDQDWQALMAGYHASGK